MYMAVRRTTIELDEDLIRSAQQATGETLRATVERALRQLVASTEAEAAERRRRVADYFSEGTSGIDVDVLLSDQAWR
jgi:Arc/MetJ family transcription regulator